MALTHQQEHAKRRQVRKEHHWRSTLPTHQIFAKGLGLADAYEHISAELLLDGQARLNLATFVTTYMPAAARAIMAVSLRAWPGRELMKPRLCRRRA